MIESPSKKGSLSKQTTDNFENTATARKSRRTKALGVWYVFQIVERSSGAILFRLSSQDVEVARKWVRQLAVAIFFLRRTSMMQSRTPAISLRETVARSDAGPDPEDLVGFILSEISFSCQCQWF